MDGIQRLVVPVDFSAMSKRALRAALAMVNRCGGELHLLHVVPEYEVERVFHIETPSRKEIERQAEKWAETAFDNYLRGEDLRGLTLLRMVRYGNPAREICRYAEEIDADLILIASHGRSGFERAVFGSVAEKVLRTAPQPVMVVKGQKSKPDAVAGDDP